MATLRVTGVDGCRGKWVAAIVEVNAAAARVTSLDWTVGDRFPDVVDATSATIGIDIPIGLTDEGHRRADQDARAALPGFARSRVFITPPRPVLVAATSHDNASIQALNQRLTGSGVSRQALALRDAIFDVEEALVSDVELRERTWEVHPELSFAQLSGQPALAAKKSAVGVAQRIRSLTCEWVPDLVSCLERAPAGVRVDDCLDSVAAAWSAFRQTTGIAHTWPPAPHPVDGRGLRMAITV